MEYRWQHRLRLWMALSVMAILLNVIATLYGLYQLI